MAGVKKKRQHPKMLPLTARRMRYAQFTVMNVSVIITAPVIMTL